MGLVTSKSTKRNWTAEENSISRDNNITLTFGQQLTTEEVQHSVKFTFAATGRSAPPEFHTGLHFHADKTECLQVVSGVIGVQVNAHKFRLTPDMGEIIVPPWTPHAWWLEGDGSIETVIWERTVPGSREKEVFFRNMLGYINDQGSRPPNLLQVFTIFARWDNYPIIAGWQRGGGRTVAYKVTKLLGWIGTRLGYRGFWEEYTPKQLYVTLK